MSKQIRKRKADSELFYPIMDRQMTDEEKRTYHRKNLYKMSEGLRPLDPYNDFDYLSIEQREYIDYRMSHPETWPLVQEIKIGEIGK